MTEFFAAWSYPLPDLLAYLPGRLNENQFSRVKEGLKNLTENKDTT
jgi:hypothetical protein